MNLPTQFPLFYKNLQLGIPFADQCTQPFKIQKDLLMGLVAKNQKSAFGIRHGFGVIRNLRDFQKRIPVSTYAYHEPYIKEAMEGHEKRLTVDEPVFYANTSGTTGSSKWIPVTEESRSHNVRMLTLWLASLCVSRPRTFSGRILSYVSPEVSPPSGSECQKPCGAESGYAYRTAHPSIQKLYSSPYEIFTLKDHDAKHYSLLRIAAAQQISFLITCNPSSVLTFARILHSRADDIIRDVREGGIGKRSVDLPPDFRARMKHRLPADPHRAEALRRLASREGGLLPRSVWPKLAAIGCWKGGTVASYLDQFSEFFSPDTAVRDLGYLASELRGSIPLTSEGDGGVLTIGTNFYEFLPVKAREDLQDDITADGRLPVAGESLLTVDQLEEGQQYYVFVSTRSGLYRYDMHDIVEVVGFFGRAPVIRFVRKGKGVISLTGEKLTETQVLRAAKFALKGLERCCQFVTVYGRRTSSENKLAGHIFIVEFFETIRKQDAVRLATSLDRALAEANIEYREKRKDRLAPLRLRIEGMGYTDSLRRRWTEQGKPDGQFKILRVTMDDSFAAGSLGAWEVSATDP